MVRINKDVMLIFCFNSHQVLKGNFHAHFLINLVNFFIFASGIFGMPARSCKDFINQ